MRDGPQLWSFTKYNRSAISKESSSYKTYFLNLLHNFVDHHFCEQQFLLNAMSIPPTAPQRSKNTTESRGIPKDDIPTQPLSTNNNPLLGQPGNSLSPLLLPMREPVALAPLSRTNRPLSAYDLFAQDKREEIASLMLHSSTARKINVDALIADWWENSTPSQRAFYTERAARELLRHQQDQAIAEHIAKEGNTSVGSESEPYCSKEAIARLASQLDDESIDFLINALL